MNPFAAWVSAKPIFIIWRGSDKSPIDPLHADPTSGAACSNAQDPATWLSWEIASAYAQSLGAGYGVGIVIHEGSGLLCVDIDGCMIEGHMSELAVRLIREARTFCPEVYVEFSMSGKGVHVIGPYSGAAPLHSTKNKELHLELYTAARYIALTGDMCPAI
jgi:primase-polymerase (primpol)-like protein